MDDNLVDGEYLFRLLGMGFDVGRVRGRNVMMNCPFHKDRRPSFGMNVHTGLFGCFGCGVRGNFEQFKSMLGLVEPGEDSLVGWRWRVEKFFGNGVFESFESSNGCLGSGSEDCNGKDGSERIEDEGGIELGGEVVVKRLCVDSDGVYDVGRDVVVSGLKFLDGDEDWLKYSPSRRYLLGRGVPENDLSFFMPGVSAIFPRRVILPSVNLDGDVEYWQARDWGGDSDVKYVTPFGRRPSGLLMNLDRIREFSEDLIVCEGPISAMVAGRHATCTYSQSFSEDQVYRVAEKGFKRVYVVYDGGEVKSFEMMVNLCCVLLDIGVDVWYCVLPDDRDPADMGRERFQLYLEKNAVRYTSVGVLASRLLRI